jgi:hypothetical protein
MASRAWCLVGVLACGGGAAAPAVVTVPPIASLPPPPPVHEAARPTAPKRDIDINFENLIHLVGVSIDPEEAMRGNRVTFTFVWRCDTPVGQGWQLFTHVDAPSGKVEHLDFYGPLREIDGSGLQRMGPEHWKAGQTYVDTQTYTVPSWATDSLIVYVGIWRGSARLRIISGPNDGENRALVGKITVK